MGKSKKNNFHDICLLPKINSTTITNHLKSRYESNLLYTQLNEGIVICLMSSNLLLQQQQQQQHQQKQQSVYFVEDYKSTNKNSSTSTQAHIFQLVNQTYLHMRRTGVDQTIILNGKSASGKTYHCNQIISHLVSLCSNQRKDNKLYTQILSTETILDQFGHTKTALGHSASRFGKFIELQFNERGRVTGYKLLSYLFDKKCILNKNNSGTFNVFYTLLMGASAEEKAALMLNNNTDYRYMKTNNTTSASQLNNTAQQDRYLELRSSFRHVGLGNRYHARIMQFLAALLHLGQLQFIDDPTAVQESAYVKNVDVLEWAADFLGVDARAIANVLTYKTRMIKNDAATLILNAEQAAEQRDELVMSLYHLLFTWLVEQMNQKLCSEKNLHNIIGILDFPGWQQQDNIAGKRSGLETFCLNYSNERVQNFTIKYLFETSLEEYKADGLDYVDVKLEENGGPVESCIELFDQPRNGFIDIINNFSKKETSTSTLRKSNDIAMLETTAKYQAGNPTFSMKKTDTGSSYFCIQHFNGTQGYEPNGFIKDNQDALNPDFISLFRGNGSDLPPSTNNFLVSLFSQSTILTESHPKQASAIMSAQQVSQSNRKPSTRRSKSTNRKIKGQKGSEKDETTVTSGSKKKKTISPVVLSQLRSSLGDLFGTIEETLPWFVYCIRSSNKTGGGQFDSKLVNSQVEAFNLAAIARRCQTGLFMNIFTHQEFINRYIGIIQKVNIDRDGLPQSVCQALLETFNWPKKDHFMTGNSKVFLSNFAWTQLEDNLRAIEKQSQRKQKDESRAHNNSSTEQYYNAYGESGYLSQQDDQSTTNGSSNTDLIINPGHSNTTDRHVLAATAAAAAGLPLPHTFTSATNNHNSSRMSSYTSGYYSEDQCSFVSEDPQQQQHTYRNPPSYDSSSFHETKDLASTIDEKTAQEQPPPAAAEELSVVRKRWLFFVYTMTFWVPTPFMVWCGRMKRKDIQIAWREKLTLCMIILFMSGFVIWFLVFFSKLICPHQSVFSPSELQSHSSAGNAYIAVRGEVFDLTRFAPYHWANQVINQNAIMAYGGKDASNLFPVQVSALCEGVNGTVSEYVSLDYHYNLTDSNSNYHDFRAWTDDYRPDWYFEKMIYLRKNYKVGTMGYTDADVHRQATNPVDVGGVLSTRVWAVLNSSVYDLTYYASGGRRVQVPIGMTVPDNIDTNYMSDVVVNLFRQKSGQDITDYWNALPLDPLVRARQEVCLRNLFYVGSLDQRNSARCIFSEYLLLIVTVFLCAIIVFKFLAALQFTTRRQPENHDKFVICQVPCYTEGEEELKKTIDSIACLQYDDKRKLLFIICDGMIVGGGNDRPTPRIVLDILGVDAYVDPEPLSFLSVGEGQKQHNMAKIYSGLYECHGHVVPYVVVSKVGKPSERQKPGNRGKRDSQLILMRFLNKVHFNAPMTPMELEIFHQLKNIIGVNPGFYEFVLMVDADTEVMADGLNRLVSTFVQDAKIIGLCGETKLSNEKDSWVTMIQVYEYFISHYMIKAFESLFGSVTCLPGCFCMYRIRSPAKNQPLLVSNQVIEDYQINRVDTLHQKNLLHLGEDRYLTTLILKHFPMYKTKFVADAKCATNAPDQWSILLSQRRRWINSTIHNLGELVFLPQLCGFCCFSMRFVVMLDLISTLVQPAIVGYLVYLIYMLATSTSAVPVMSIITIAGVYGLQAIIFIIHKQWEHIIWMIVSIFAIPVFSLYIPIYAYWHFDDFSWGNTRVVLGDKGKKVIMGADEGRFDPETIPTMTWEEYEEGLYTDDGYKDITQKNGSSGGDDNKSVRSKGSSYTHGSYVSYGSYGSGRPATTMQQQPQGQFYQQQAMLPQQPSATYLAGQQYPYNSSLLQQQQGMMMGGNRSSVYTNMTPSQSFGMFPQPMMPDNRASFIQTPQQEETMRMSMNGPYNNNIVQYSFNPSSPLHRYDV